MAVKHSHYGPSTVYDVSQPTRLSVSLSACLSLCLPVCLSSCWLFPAAVQAIVLFRLRSPLSLLMLWQDVRVLQKSNEENKIFSILPVLCPLDFHFTPLWATPNGYAIKKGEKKRVALLSGAEIGIQMCPRVNR